MSQDVPSPPLKTRVGVRELRDNLTHYLREASQGRSIVVTSRDVPIAEIHPPADTLRAPRRPGALRGRIHMSEDFDTWPDDVVAAIET